MKLLKEDIDTEFKDYLNKYSDLINENKFVELYDRFPKHLYQRLTQILYKIGLNPLLSHIDWINNSHFMFEPYDTIESNDWAVRVKLTLSHPSSARLRYLLEEAGIDIYIANDYRFYTPKNVHVICPTDDDAPELISAINDSLENNEYFDYVKYINDYSYEIVDSYSHDFIENDKTIVRDFIERYTNYDEPQMWGLFLKLKDSTMTWNNRSIISGTSIGLTNNYYDYYNSWDDYYIHYDGEDINQDKFKKAIIDLIKEM